MPTMDSMQRAAKEKAAEAKRATQRAYSTFRNSEGFYKMRRGWNLAWHRWNETPRLERKAMEATNSEPWGPTGSELAALAEATFDAAGAADVARAVGKRISPQKPNPRGTYKALVVTEYVLIHGGGRFLEAMRAMLDTFLGLQSYAHVRKDGVDDGASVRRKAVVVTELLADEDALRQAQKKARELRGRFRGFSGDGRHAQTGHIADDTWEGASPLAGSRSPASTPRARRAEDSLALVPREAGEHREDATSMYIHPAAIVEAPAQLGALKVPDWSRPETGSSPAALTDDSQHAFEGSHGDRGAGEGAAGPQAAGHPASLLDDVCRADDQGANDLENLAPLSPDSPGPPPSYASIDLNPF